MNKKNKTTVIRHTCAVLHHHFSSTGTSPNMHRMKQQEI